MDLTSIMAVETVEGLDGVFFVNGLYSMFVFGAILLPLFLAFSVLHTIIWNIASRWRCLYESKVIFHTFYGYKNLMTE